ncbi:MAG TPA: septum formation initiator family protein [Clostridia bacterium]|jgi:cell division protein FtsB|nr:septum formation initiator family protein [Clostridia bacterium]HPQ47766.1 septum formation initiator family protein [Clostridia bacterium]HRX42865.1 septum formation initiator family protein [Clostridia bacterium]
MKKWFGKVFINIGKIALAVYIVYVLVSQQPIMDAKENQKEELEKELAAAIKQEIELRTDISMADSKYYIEQAAREKLGMVKPGDRVFIDIRD